MELEAVIFGVDGTLAETERHGHRVAFNRAFERAGLPDRWDEEKYGELERYERLPLNLFTGFRDARTSEVTAISGPGSYPKASWHGKSVCCRPRDRCGAPGAYPSSFRRSPTGLWSGFEGPRMIEGRSSPQPRPLRTSGR